MTAESRARTVLVVDSDPESLAYESDAFRRAGYSVVGVQTFQEAKGYLAKIVPDLMVVDVRLGAFNGLHLVVNRHHEHPDKPSIVTHAHSDAVLAREAQSAGAIYLVKPVAVQQLLDLAADLLHLDRDPEAEDRRRWSRRQITRSVPARVDQVEATLLDVSTGGFRLESPEAVTEPTATYVLTVPTFAVTIRAKPVWSAGGSQKCVVGAAVLETDPEAVSAWRQFVDRWPALIAN